MLLKPRTLAVCVVALAVTVLVIHEDSRAVAHSALTSVGIPLPNELPDMGLDHVKAGIQKWTDGLANGAGGAWPSSEPDDMDLGIEWQNITAPTDPTSLADHDEPLVNKMVYHPQNGYLLLPDPAKSHALKPIEEEQHPILELIANAEKKWDALVAKQSKTLKEAVVEYKKRYNRNPPAGFDKW
jgi:hypothetical protein